MLKGLRASIRITSMAVWYVKCIVKENSEMHAYECRIVERQKCRWTHQCQETEKSEGETEARDEEEGGREG